MNLPEFFGSQVGKEPQNFIDKVKKIFVVMQVIVVIGWNRHPTSLRMWLPYVNSVERSMGYSYFFNLLCSNPI